MISFKEEISKIHENSKIINELGNCQHVTNRMGFKPKTVPYFVTKCNECSDNDSICCDNCQCPIETHITHDAVPNQSNIRKGCKCFDQQGYCMKCPGHHHWTQHIKTNYIYEYGQIRENVTMEALK